MKNNVNNIIQHKPCERYGDQDYFRYVRHQMPEQDEHAFEEHADTCSSCLQGIRHATVVNHSQQEQAENELLYTRTLSVMDSLDQTIFSIVIRAVKGVVELIRSTGEQMVMNPALAGVRSSSETSDYEAKQLLRLVKEFEDSRLSVEVTISPVEPDLLDIVVSLLDRNIEEFIPGVSVLCQGANYTLNETTDDNGQASFKVPAAGFYELVMKKNNHLLGTMTLTGLC